MIGDFCVWISKYVLCIFNFLCFIISTILLGIGIWLALDKASLIALTKIVERENVNQFTQPHLIEQLALVIIVIAGVMFFLSFLGYCGAISESRCLLAMYGGFMVILLIAELVFGGLLAFYKNNARDETKAFLQTSITKYYSTVENTDAITLMWNDMMSKLGCCGINNYHDFENSAWYETKGNHTIPEACCVLKDIRNLVPRDNDCVFNPNEDNSFYLKGCYESVLEWVNTNRYIIIGVLIGVAGVQLLSIFLAFALFKAFYKYHAARL